MKRYAVSQALFDALIKHYWRAKDEDVPKTAALYPKGYCISYGKLIEMAGVPLDPRQAGGPLFEIASYCCDEWRVPLHALVINKETGAPGGQLDNPQKGFFGAPCSSQDLTGWETVDIPKCIEASLPRTAPQLPQDYLTNRRR